MTNESSNTPSNNIPKEVRDYYEKGIAAIKRGNYGYAVELFSSALALKQDYAEARYYLWLSLWERQKRSPDALKMRMIIGKITGFFLTLRGLSLKKSGKTWEAVYQLEKSMKFDPCNIRILNAIAECLLSENQTLNAVKILEAIPLLDKKNYNAFKKLGKLYASLDNYDKARAYYEAAIDVNPSDEEAEQGLKDLDALRALKGSFVNPENR
ncbi:MAG: tetratricopeptide repeat protein [Candidatus Omnitrophota bacterium]